MRAATPFNRLLGTVCRLKSTLGGTVVIDAAHRQSNSNLSRLAKSFSTSGGTECVLEGPWQSIKPFSAHPSAHYPWTLQRCLPSLYRACKLQKLLLSGSSFRKQSYFATAASAPTGLLWQAARLQPPRAGHYYSQVASPRYNREKALCEKALCLKARHCLEAVRG